MARSGIVVIDRMVKGAVVGKRWLFRVWDARSGTYCSGRFDDHAEGRTWAEEQQAKFTLNLDRAGRLYLADISKAFVDDLIARGRSTRYVEDVQTTMKQLAEFGITDLKAENLADRIRAYLVAVKGCQPRRMGVALAPRTKNKKLIHIKALINFALNNERLHHNPIRGVKLIEDPARRREKTIFSIEELRKMVAPSRESDPYFLTACLLVYLGARVGEANAIRWSWWDKESNVIRIKQDPSYRLKFHRERQIPIQPELAGILERMQHKKDGTLKPMSATIADPKAGGTSSFTHGPKFAAYLKRCGITQGKRSPHNVRHTWVSLMLASNAPTHTVMLAAGHTHLVTTQRYAHAVRADAVKGWAPGQFALRSIMLKQAAPITQQPSPANNSGTDGMPKLLSIGTISWRSPVPAEAITPYVSTA